MGLGRYHILIPGTLGILEGKTALNEFPTPSNCVPKVTTKDGKSGPYLGYLAPPAPNVSWSSLPLWTSLSVLINLFPPIFGQRGVNFKMVHKSCVCTEDFLDVSLAMWLPFQHLSIHLSIHPFICSHIPYIWWDSGDSVAGGVQMRSTEFRVSLSPVLISPYLGIINHTPLTCFPLEIFGLALACRSQVLFTLNPLT